MTAQDRAQLVDIGWILHHLITVPIVILFYMRLWCWLFEYIYIFGSLYSFWDISFHQWCGYNLLLSISWQVPHIKQMWRSDNSRLWCKNEKLFKWWERKSVKHCTKWKYPGKKSFRKNKKIHWKFWTKKKIEIEKKLHSHQPLFKN